MNKPDESRRRFLTQVAMAVPAGAVLLNTVVANSAQAAAQAGALPKLSLDDPSAKALGYVEDHMKVDRKSPLAARWAADQDCANCSQIQGKDGEEYRPCNIFPGKLVHSKGWCSAWNKKA